MMELLFSFARDIQPGRLIESLIFLFVLWGRVKPHFKKIEDRMAGMENAVNNLTLSMANGFAAGETRFSNIEKRLDVIENPQDDFVQKSLTGKE